MPHPYYYRILGISPSAGWEEVRRRYRALARQHHPDRNPDNPEAAAHFRLVVEAYEAIKEAQAGTKTHRRRQAAQNYRHPRFTGKEKAFEDLFGIARSGSTLEQSAGADFRYDLEIPLADAIRGLSTVIGVDRHLNCPPCSGTGLAPGSGYQGCPDCRGRGRRFGGPGQLRFGPRCDRCQGRGKIAVRTCRHCDGQGRSPETRRYQLDIPPGIRDGTRLHIQGEGGAGFLNGPQGDLVVVVHVAPHEIFTRVGNDLCCRLEVSFAQAALGGQIFIPTLEGYRTFDLPRGTQTGRIFRFPGCGAPGGPQASWGDQVMEVVVTTPESLSPRQKEILAEMARLDQAGND
jgi:molecular chaperone DnaJ